jgi:hypothetical protein
MLPQAAALGRAMNEHLFATIQELAAQDDEDLREITRVGAEGNIEQVLRLYRLGAGIDALVVPVEATAHARGMVHRGIAVPTLLRIYRIGHAWLWDSWSQALEARIEDPDVLSAAREYSSALLFAYVDRMSDVVVETYGSERERLSRGAAQLRAETVRAILAGEVIDEEVATGRLGYALDRHHVALRMWGGTEELRGLERAAREAAARLGSSDPLVVPMAVASLDVWWGSYEAVEVAALESYEPPDGIRVAFGAPGHGVAGFRRSHVEAMHAARIVTLAGGRAPAVTSYARVELVSLLASDLPRARAFVATQLGPLASGAEPAARLRDTVLAFLETGGSPTRVAKDFFVHQNTVTYRVKRVEELIGRRVTERPGELICALQLAAVLGDAVLDGDDPVGD